MSESGLKATHVRVEWISGVNDLPKAPNNFAMVYLCRVPCKGEQIVLELDDIEELFEVDMVRHKEKGPAIALVRSLGEYTRSI